MRAQGYVQRKPLSDEEVTVCPSCDMYICSIPGSLVLKHLFECGGVTEDWLRIEQEIVEDVRRKNYEAAILEERMREQAEQEAIERRERYDRVREELLQRQLDKDRKRRIREETKQEWKTR
jgi:hypothetical protein